MLFVNSLFNMLGNSVDIGICQWMSGITFNGRCRRRWWK